MIFDLQNTNWFLYFCAASVNLLAVSTGNAYGWTSPSIPVLSGHIPGSPLLEPITRTEESLIASLLSLGATCGPLISGLCAEKFGRKKTLMTFSLLITASYAVTAFSSSVSYYFVARFVLGIGCGCMFTVVPMYIGEIAENSNRGVLGCILGIMISLGNLICYIFGPLTSVRVLTIICAIPAILFLVLFGIFAPESPYYLVSMNEKTAAMHSLIKLRKKSESSIEKELVEIEKCVDECSVNKGGISELTKSKRAIKALIICVGTMFFQQFAGITVVLCYMQTIFDASGSSIPGDLSSISIGSIQFLINILTSQLVDRLGRRILFLISALGCSLSLAGLGTFFFLKDNEVDLEALFWLPIASLGAYIICFNIGLGPLPWTVAGELFPTNLKSICSTITASSCLLMAFVITMVYPTLSSELGIAQTFWIFSACCGIGIIFFARILPETKAKSFEEIQNMLGRM